MAILDINQTKKKLSGLNNQPVTSPIINPVNPMQPKLPTQNLGMRNMEDVTRKAPTVATAQQPVISKTTNNSLIYDPNDPEDYLMKLQARGVTGKTPTEQEYYQALQAQKSIQARTTASNPFQSQIDELLKQQQEQKALESGRDTTQFDTYKQQIDQQFGNQRDELLAGGERQRSAAQNVYSFSGFGRSTAAANKMVDIQRGVDSSIASLNALKEASIAAKRAELEGADSATLAEINKRVSELQGEANKRQIDSLRKTAEANQTTGASYIESLNNLIATANKSQMNIGDPKDIQIYAQMARNPDGSINEQFVSALPEGIQAIIRTANIQQSKDAPKIENFGTTKSPKYMQRDGSKRVPIAGVGGSVMGGSGGGGGRGGKVSATGSSGVSIGGGTVYNDLMGIDPGKFKNVDQSNSYGFATNAILANEDIKNNEGFVTGLSAGKATLYRNIPSFAEGLKPEELKKQEQGERNFINSVLRKESGAAIPDSELENARKQYFPQPGDSQTILKQKEQNRAVKINALIASSGKNNILTPIAQKTFKKTAPTQQTPQKATAPSTGAGRWVKK